MRAVRDHVLRGIRGLLLAHAPAMGYPDPLPEAVDIALRIVVRGRELEGATDLEARRAWRR